MHPCFSDASDFRAYGPPETTVELPGETTLGMVVLRPFGPGTDAILTLHAKVGNGNDGGEITLAITDSVDLHIEPKPVDVPAQGHPVRETYWTDDDNTPDERYR